MDRMNERLFLVDDHEVCDQQIRAAHKALGSFIWLGNNLHNSGSETFRELYRACLEDAVTAYNATLAEGEKPTDPADRLDIKVREG